MSRVGILGGTFDPPHNGHVAMAEAAVAGLALDRLLILPAPDPPHKNSHDISPYPSRRRMAELAFAGLDNVELSDIEEGRHGPSYTVDLLQQLAGADDLYFVVGADSVCDLPAWREPERILALATLVVFPRSGYSPRVPVDSEASVVLFESPVIDVSSSQVRSTAVAGEDIGGLVPADVAKFILDNSVYS